MILQHLQQRSCLLNNRWRFGMSWVLSCFLFNVWEVIISKSKSIKKQPLPFKSAMPFLSFIVSSICRCLRSTASQWCLPVQISSEPGILFLKHPPLLLWNRQNIKAKDRKLRLLRVQSFLDKFTQFLNASHVSHYLIYLLYSSSVSSALNTRSVAAPGQNNQHQNSSIFSDSSVRFIPWGDLGSQLWVNPSCLAHKARLYSFSPYMKWLNILERNIR